MIMRFFLLGLLCITLNACAFGNSYWTDSSLKKMTQDDILTYPVTISVLPFTTKDQSNISSFESLYFPAKLTQILKQSPIVKNAYVAYEATPSTNYYITGEVKLSDGENTEINIKMFNADNTQLLSFFFGYANERSDFASNSQLDKLWYRAANKILGTIADAKVPDKKLLRAQLAGYAGQSVPATLLNEKMRRTIYDVSTFENEKLLFPYTENLYKKLELLEPRYVTWQKSCTENAVAKRSAENRQALEIFVAILGAAASAQAKANGDDYNARQLEGQSRDMMNMSIESGGEASKHGQLILEVGNLIDNNIRDEQVSINDTNTTLQGSITEKVAALRGIVKKMIDAEMAQ